MTEREALIEGIREYDPDAMLVLADWLEEYGVERDHPLAVGLRWCAKHGRWPRVDVVEGAMDEEEDVYLVWEIGKDYRDGWKKKPWKLPPCLGVAAAGRQHGGEVEAIAALGEAILKVREVVS